MNSIRRRQRSPFLSTGSLLDHQDQCLPLHFEPALGPDGTMLQLSLLEG